MTNKEHDRIHNSPNLSSMTFCTSFLGYQMPCFCSVWLWTWSMMMNTKAFRDKSLDTNMYVILVT